MDLRWMLVSEQADLHHSYIHFTSEDFWIELENSDPPRDRYARIRYVNHCDSASFPSDEYPEKLRLQQSESNSQGTVISIVTKFNAQLSPNRLHLLTFIDSKWALRVGECKDPPRGG